MLVRILALLAFSLMLEAQAIELKLNNSINLSSSKPSINTKLGISEVLTSEDNIKGAIIKVVSADKSKLKIKPATVKLVASKSGEVTASRVTFFAPKSVFSSLSGEEQIEISFVPNAKATELGFSESTAIVTLVPGDTESLQVQMSFAGDPLLPQSASSPLLARRTARKTLTAEDGPIEITNPANAGSCALGFGDEPLSTTTGPGDDALRYGSGATDDPLYIVFNNPNTGLDSETVDVSSIPADLLTSEGVPGFAQMYAGPNGSSDVLVTVTGVITVDPETQTLNLTLPDGTVINYSKDGSKTASSAEDLSSLIANSGLDLNAAVDFYSDEVLEISIPAADMQANILEGMGTADEVDEPSVTLTGPITGTLTMTANELTGSFSGSGIIEFDVADNALAGPQVLSGTNNIQMTISADKPALLSGFTLTNAKGTLTISGGAGIVKSITAEFIVNSADVSIDGGITASDVTVTSVTPEIDISGFGAF